MDYRLDPPMVRWTVEMRDQSSVDGWVGQTVSMRVARMADPAVGVKEYSTVVMWELWLAHL